MSEMALELIRRAKAEGWKRLDLGNCGIVGAVPEEIGELEELEELILSDEWWDFEKNNWSRSENNGPSNAINRLAVKMPSNILSIVSQNTQIEDLGPLQHLHDLENINFAKSKISTLSPINGLKKVRYLHVAETQISDISPIAGFSEMQILHISRTKVNNLKPLACLNKVSSLYLNDNRIFDITPLGNLKFLKKLYLHSTAVAEINALCNLEELEELSLSSTKVYDIQALSNLTNLLHLTLSSTKIQNIEALSGLKKLRILHLAITKIEDLNPLEKLSDLEILGLSNTKVKDISVIVTLPNLKELNLSHTSISDFTLLRKIPNPNSLRYLNLSNTNFSDLGLLRPTIASGTQVNFSGSKGINVKGCPLVNPPLEIVEQGRESILRFWEQMDISTALELKPYINRDVKLILVGNPDSGKTTLAKFLSQSILSEDHPVTHGLEITNWQPEFGLKKLKGEDGNPEGRCQVRIFDFGGQEYYHDTHHLFFTTNTAYILLWDNQGNRLAKMLREKRKGLTAIKSGPLEQHYPLEYWLDAVAHFTSREDIPEASEENFWEGIFEKPLVIDEDWEPSFFADSDEEFVLPPDAWEALERFEEFEEFEELDELDEYELEVDENPHLILLQTRIDRDGIAFLDQNALKDRYPFIYDFGAVCLREKREQRLEQTRLLVQELLEQVEIVGGKLPPQYGWVKDELEIYKSPKYYLKIEELQEWANQVIFNHNVSKELQLDRYQTLDLVGYLLRIGLLLHFPDSSELRDIIFIKPNEVMKRIYQILGGVNMLGGRFDESDAIKALEDPKKTVRAPRKAKKINEETKTILELMRRFRIIFSEGGKAGTYVAPLYLPNEPIQGVQLLIDLFQKPVFRIQYSGFIHKSVVLHFFEKFGPEALKDRTTPGNEMYYYWRNGIIVKDSNSNAIVLVQFSINERNALRNMAAHIDLFELAQNSNPTFLETINEALVEINSGWNTTTLVTHNGEDFVPLEVVEKAAEERQFTFFHNEHIFQLLDFRKFITLKMPMKKVFISYSKTDLEFLQQLESHLSVFKRNGHIATWTDRKLSPGEAWDGKIKKELEEADIIIFLVSADFLSTDYVWDIEIKTAIERDARGEAKVVPIVVRPCVWKDTPLWKFYAAEKATPISMAANRDAAWEAVVTDLERIMVGGTEGGRR